MTAYFPVSEKPGMVTAISILTLISGITNILIGIGVSAGVVVSTFGIGLLCIPLTILPIILGIFEIIYAAQLLPNPPKVIKLNTTIAILELIAIVAGNVISLVTGILVLIAQNDPDVKNYFAQLDSVNVY